MMAFKNLRPFLPRNTRVTERGAVVPYDVVFDADGSLFGEGTDYWIERRMLETGRCGVCGDELGDEVAFVGTREAVATGWFCTPGLHVDCALVCWEVCPYIANPKWDPAPGMESTRSDDLALVIFDDYSYSRTRWWFGKLVLKARRLNRGFARGIGQRHIEWHTGRREMLAHVNATGGCPTHRETTATTCPAHRHGTPALSFSPQRTP